jgi:hypothetical protein
MRRTARGLAGLALLVGAFGAGLPASVMAADAALNQQLLSAARSGDEAGVQAALDAGAVVDSRNRIGDTALITACKNGAAGIARTVIEHGANVRQADASGVTPLMGAAYGGYDSVRCCSRTAPIQRLPIRSEKPRWSMRRDRDIRRWCSACWTPAST